VSDSTAWHGVDGAYEWPDLGLLAAPDVEVASINGAASRVSWPTRNLGELEERPSVRPTLGGVGLFYPGKRHVASGPQEAAKTMAAYAVALEEVRSGGLVVLIDFEMGPFDARDRLREMGATDDDLARILYVEPETPATEETILALLALRPTLVVIDASAGAYDLQGLDDNKRADAEKFARIWVRPFWTNGVATLVLDHVVKNSESRGKYAIGSERKVGGVDVHLGFECVFELNRGGHGLYKIVTHKDRGGWLPRPTAGELELWSDPDTHAIRWAFKPPQPPEEETDEGFRPTTLMERVSIYLEGQDEPVSRNSVEEAVKGKGRYVRLAIDCLVREGYVTETRGARKARLLLSKQAFRDDDFVPTSSQADDDDFVPTSSPDEPHNQAENTTSSQFVPTSSQEAGATSSQSVRVPTGDAALAGRGGNQDEIDADQRAALLDEQYPPNGAAADEADVPARRRAREAGE
jgi:hypothetical protein